MFRNVSPDLVRSGMTRPANLGVRSCPVLSGQKAHMPILVEPYFWGCGMLHFKAMLNILNIFCLQQIKKRTLKYYVESHCIAFQDVENFPLVKWMKKNPFKQIETDFPTVENCWFVWNLNFGKDCKIVLKPTVIKKVQQK